MSTIVVGVDGSESAQEALDFAAREARLRGAGLRVVMTWSMPTMAYDGMGGFSPDIDPTVFEESARAALDATLATLDEQADGIEIEQVLCRGQPAQVLVEQARTADLLVVGSRGRGGFAGLLLGSVSHQCAQHAPCPVVIVRAPSRPA